MPSKAKCHRTWFALVREAGILPEDRHAVQEEITGQASTKDWTKSDYRRAIAQIQRDLGQHSDPHAHIKEDRTHGVADTPGTWATPQQADYIADLVDRIEWRVGPVAYVCQHLLAGDTMALRRESLKRAAEHGSGPPLWSHLTREEASDLIKALRKMTCVYPREESHVGS